MRNHADAAAGPDRVDLRVDWKVYRRAVFTYRISQLAERVGLRPTTLRFYEQAGLLPAHRSESDVLGVVICLVGVAVIMYAPRG